jgi:major outer membrane protein
MKLNPTILALLLILIGSACQVHAQQRYVGPPQTGAQYGSYTVSPGQPAAEVYQTALLFGGGETPQADACDDPSCLDEACADDCCGPRWQFYGEFLYLRPGNDKVSYAVPINGAIVPPAGVAPVQVGPEGTVDNGFQPGFSIGLGYALSECSNIGASYTYFESNTADTTTRSAPFVLRSLVHHPGTANAATDFLQADAAYSIDFQMLDVEFNRLLASGDLYALRYVIGARYGQLDQDFQSIFSNSTTTEIVATDVNFDGGGIRFGLEGERHAECSGFMVYAKGNASFLGGEFTGSYLQGDAFGGNVVNTGWTDDRIVSIVDAEIGVGYTCCESCLRFTIGYMVSAWGNVVTTDDFIQSVQTNNSTDVSDTLTFDGLTSRVEFRY